MAKFVKIEHCEGIFGQNLEPTIWLNTDHIVAVFVKNNLTHISTVDGHCEKTKWDVEKVLQEIARA